MIYSPAILAVEYCADSERPCSQLSFDTIMLPLDRLVELMLTGAALGFSTFAGLGDRNYEALAGAILGAHGGLIAECFCRVRAKRSWSFSTFELLTGVTLAAVTIGLINVVFRWISLGVVAN